MDIPAYQHLLLRHWLEPEVRGFQVVGPFAICICALAFMFLFLWLTGNLAAHPGAVPAHPLLTVRVWGAASAVVLPPS